MMDRIDNLVRQVQDANPGRSVENLERRILKAAEEFGEANEAFLNVTSHNNPKGLTWHDFREEVVDFLIVVLDVTLTPTQGVVNPNLARLMYPTLVDEIPTQKLMRMTGAELGRLMAVPDDTVPGPGDLLRYVLSLLLRPLPGDNEGDDLLAKVEEEMARKLHKWTSNRQRMVTMEDDV